jgi:hypothetical protein
LEAKRTLVQGGTRPDPPLDEFNMELGGLQGTIGPGKGDLQSTIGAKQALGACQRRNKQTFSLRDIQMRLTPSSSQ